MWKGHIKMEHGFTPYRNHDTEEPISNRKSESETVVTEQEQSSLKPDTADQQDSVPNFGTEQMASAENERIRGNRKQ